MPKHSVAFWGRRVRRGTALKGSTTPPTFFVSELFGRRRSNGHNHLSDVRQRICDLGYECGVVPGSHRQRNQLQETMIRGVRVF